MKKSIAERARELYNNLPIIQEEYIGKIEDSLKEQKAIDDEVCSRSLVLLAAKILEPLGAGLPSCYYESMEKSTLEEIADIVVKRVRNTKME